MASPSFDMFPGELHVADARHLEIADELIRLASGGVNAQLEGLAHRLLDALQAAADASPGHPDAAWYAVAATHLRQNRYRFSYGTSAHMRTMLERAIEPLVRPDSGLPDAAMPPIALPPEREIDKRISLIKLGRSLEQALELPMTALGARLAQAFGRADLPGREHPLRPVLFLYALHDAWCEFQPDPAVHPLLYPLLQPALCLDPGPIFQALNTALARRGILPALPHQPQPAAVPPQPQADSAGEFPALFHDDALRARRGHDALREHLASLPKPGIARPSPGHAGTARSATALHELLQHSSAVDWPAADRAAVTLLIGIFDALFRERQIPADMKNLLGTLQLPLLRLALSDPDFFSCDSHPARSTIELLANLGIAHDYRDDTAGPLHLRLRQSVSRLHADPRYATFAAIATELASIATDAGSDALPAALIEQALAREKRVQAARSAMREVELRAANGDIPVFVERFLDDTWTSVLTFAYGLEKERPGAAVSALKTMDDLCRSVKPNSTPDQRKQLIARLPSIVAMLNQWLDAIRWHGAARTQFFDTLARCHAAIVRAPFELSPERQLQFVVKAGKEAEVRRQQRQPRLPPDDECMRQVRCLAPGMPLRFARGKDAPVKALLAWVSPMRTVFVFAGRDRRQAFLLSDEELAQALRDANAQVLSVSGLVRRTLAGMPPAAGPGA
jgi:hypothetical protein